MAKGGLRLENRDDLEKWLKEQPRDVSTCIGARATLRVLPVAARPVSIGEVEKPARKHQMAKRARDGLGRI